MRPEQLLVKVPLFRSLPQYEFERIVRLVRLRTFLADERVIRKGTDGDSMFLNGRGVVVPADAVPDFYVPGTIFMATGRGGYVGLVRLEDGRLDVVETIRVRAEGNHIRRGIYRDIPLGGIGALMRD